MMLPRQKISHCKTVPLNNDIEAAVYTVSGTSHIKVYAVIYNRIEMLMHLTVLEDFRSHD
jgi:hypothetical protein